MTVCCIVDDCGNAVPYSVNFGGEPRLTCRQAPRANTERRRHVKQLR